MDVYEEFRRRSFEKISRHSADFQRVLGRNLLEYTCDTEAGII